jgi:hypothetical protein
MLGMFLLLAADCLPEERYQIIAPKLQGNLAVNCKPKTAGKGAPRRFGGAPFLTVGFRSKPNV